MGMMRPVLADIQGRGAFDESRAPPNDLYSDGELCDSNEFVDIELVSGNTSRQFT